MEKLEEIKIKGLKDIPLCDIEVAEGNVRKSRQQSGLESLKTSIEKIGLLQPVILFQEGKDKKYKLVVGQRRFLAFCELHRETIPAIIIDAINPTTEMVVSFGENIQRKALPYDDTIQVCDELFESSTGEPMERI